MPSADEPSTIRTNGTSSRSDQLAYYKKQYEQLESELSDFQASSRELEAELEKEIEASEKRERQLKERVDNLRYEVDEWKSKYKQSKSEASTAQNTLQKEITSLREVNVKLQLKLRDTEVANDDYERQARHTTSSLEDMESKYNQAVEREVLLDMEYKQGEQERESLRIENQRLRDELNDLKIETEIVQERLRNNGRRRRPAPLGRTPSTPHTPEIFDRSPGESTVSSPLFSTPPTKLSLTLASATATPPSPPMSETSSSMRKSLTAASGFPLQKASASESFGTRSLYGNRPQRFQTHSRATSFAFSNGRSTSSVTTRPSLPKPNNNINPANRPSAIPKSGSLHQIRGLIGKMQKLEERVQSAKSKLPPPSETASRTSSRAGSVLDSSPGAATIAMRRETRKRLSGSSFSSSIRDGDGVPSYVTSSRPSYGTRTQGDSRPSSRTSFSSSLSHSTHPSVTPSNRPESRQSRTKTPLGHYSTNPTTESRRPRSSLSNPAGQSTPVNGMSFIDEDEDLAEEFNMRATISSSRPTRLPSFSNPAFSTPTGLKKRSTSGIPAPRSFRRTNTMGPPKSKPTAGDLGETF
ncbi:nuclear distribution protein NudE [Aspergillus mulundensis]|uniref:Nuclear distribution protein nudE n=1 Tax=Aspergillus mulundensis TaxID=1810919 RepID=A0A3D8SW27_9EURO|nr:Nuclear distribution protein nudE [Aspergillus mulundensis]RDW90522.1 Nuclear distribution protein nudE [Aspergillus mulundensis]